MDSSIIWLLIGPILEGCLVALLVKRKAYREFHFFFWFLIFSIAAEILRYTTQHHFTRKTYFWTYWSTAFLYDTFNLLVLYEVFRRTFREFYRRFSWFRLLFPGAVILALIPALLFHMAFRNPHELRGITLLFSFEIAVDLIELSLFAVFFLLVKFFALPWRNYAFGVVLGFALLSIGSWGAYWLRLEPSLSYRIFFRYIPAISYFCALLLWLAVFNRPEPNTGWALKVKPEELLQELREYGKILAAIRRR
ncbi:MAG: hypothetical protein DMG65_02110 [Candidatus Angelobacter sp. Gp1-AA117]|nr:MAG: hypothetical protein DMG65_02110 [Candidatus Angelobacter sp. Gp1-AA117]